MGDRTEDDDLDLHRQDEMTDETATRIITFEEVSAAAYRIHSGVEKTVCKKMLDYTDKMEIYAKNEFTQYTGSFKERGVRNAFIILSSQRKPKGVVAVTRGNYAQALSYQGKLLNIPVTVVMPTSTPLMKIQMCQSYGSDITVIVEGSNMSEAKQHAMKLSQEKGLTFLSGFDNPHTIAGYGTIGLEILEDVPDIDAVLIPVGGGGLIAGVATAIKHLRPSVLIYGVETDKCASMKLALEKNGPTMMQCKPTLADGLAVPMVGRNAFATVKPLLDKMLTVKEEYVARAILQLVEKSKYAVEGAGAVGLAAIIAGLVPELAGKKVALILSGGNIITSLMDRSLQRGLAGEGRLVKFIVTVDDQPGGIPELCELLTNIGVAIKDVTQEASWVHGDIFSVHIKVLCETRGPPHTAELSNVLAKNYKEWRFVTDAKETSCRPVVQPVKPVQPFKCPASCTTGK